MDLLNAVILGLIQGITEFLPISSSGHLVIGNYLLGVENNSSILFEVVVHLGTLFSILFYFKNEILHLFKGIIKREGKSLNYFLLIAIATIPAVFIGIMFNNQIKELYNIESVSLFLLITGVIIFSSKFAKQKSIELTYLHVFIIGCAQAFAILPGISRSGTTITVALLLGMSTQKSSQFSFFIAIPVIIGAVLLEITKINQIDNIYNLLAGFITSFAVGYFSISWLIRLINKLHFWKFSFYVWFLGVIINYYV